jgi:unsaturated rhamnogalacturonyl hydrolase
MLLERLKIASLCASLVFALNVSAFAQEATYFTNWPAGLSPQEGGKRVAEHFVTSPHQYGATIHYSQCHLVWRPYFASLTHDDALRTRLIHRFEPLMPGGAEAARMPVRHHGYDCSFTLTPDPSDALT